MVPLGYALALVHIVEDLRLAHGMQVVPWGDGHKLPWLIRPDATEPLGSQSSAVIALLRGLGECRGRAARPGRERPECADGRG